MNITFEKQLIPRFLAGPWHTAKHQSSVDTNYLSDKANISRFNRWYHTSQAKKPKPNKTQNQTKANHQNKTKQKTPNQTQKSFLPQVSGKNMCNELYYLGPEFRRDNVHMLEGI